MEDIIKSQSVKILNIKTKTDLSFAFTLMYVFRHLRDALAFQFHSDFSAAEEELWQESVTNAYY